MKSATRGWNNAEGNPVLLRRRDHTAEAYFAGFAMITVSPVSMNSRGSRVGGLMPPVPSR